MALIEPTASIIPVNIDFSNTSLINVTLT